MTQTFAQPDALYLSPLIRSGIPEVLSKYAEHFSADPDLWLFLTGDKAATYRLAQQGFKLGIGEQPNPPEVVKKTGEEKEFFHSNELILVDRNAQIRGYYSGIDAEAMVRLRRDLKTLLAEKNNFLKTRE